jgi:hypothetical protein
MIVTKAVSLTADENFDGPEAVQNADRWVSQARSKREERLRKKLDRKQLKKSTDPKTIFHLPYELLIHVLIFLEPKDLIRLSRVDHGLANFIREQEHVLSQQIIDWRYPNLSRCFRLPVLLADVPERSHEFLLAEERTELIHFRDKPYQHVQPPDPTFICTCLTCTLRWNSLCLAIDFAHWQLHLDLGQPIPIIPRGRKPAWNQSLLAKHADVVRKALERPLWHAAILQTHLASTVRSITRQQNNKSNRRGRFRMTAADAASGLDWFLERSGPPTMDFPPHRDTYYLLEAFMPSRSWISELGEWKYMPAAQHEVDVGIVERFVRWRREQDVIQRVRREELAKEAEEVEEAARQKEADAAATGLGKCL